MKLSDLITESELQQLDELKAGKYAQIASLLGALASQHGGKAADAATVGWKQQAPHALATLATYADPKKLSALPATISADELNKGEDEWKRQREKQKIGRLIPSLKEGDSPFRWDGRYIHAGPWKLEPSRDAIAAIPPSGTKDAVNIYNQAKRKHYGRGGEIYLQQMDQHGIPKGLQPYIAAYLQGKATPEQIANHLASKLAGMKESDMRMNELDNRLPDNFNIDDIKKMEKMSDINQMKAFAKELISTPSQKPMRPEKVAWLKKTIDSKRKPIDVVKLMYDLMLGGEGKHVIGSRHSMDPNSYRRAFKEEEKDWTSRFRVGCTLIDRNSPAASSRGKKIFKNVWVRAEDEFDAKKVAQYYYRKKGYSVVDCEITTPVDEGNKENKAKKKIVLPPTQRPKDKMSDFDPRRDLKKKVAEDKKKGKDGKACWKGYRYAGTENNKDKCVKSGK